MREINEIETFIDDDFYDIVNDEMTDVEVQNSASTDYLNVNGRNNKTNNNDDDKVISNETDSGIIYDPEERNCSELSISDKTTQSGRVDSGIDSISKISSIREFKNFKSLSKSSIKSSSVSTVVVPMREQFPLRSTSKLRSKRYSLPDIDKLKTYNNDVKQCTKRQNQRKTELLCDAQKETQPVIPLVPTETKPLNALSSNKDKLDTFIIDPKLINKFDGLSQSLYYVDDNGSPKIREGYIKQQRLLIEKQEQKKREKAARKSLDSEASCSCFNFSRLSKKLKELCKF